MVKLFIKFLWVIPFVILTKSETHSAEPPRLGQLSITGSILEEGTYQIIHEFKADPAINPTSTFIFEELLIIPGFVSNENLYYAAGNRQQEEVYQEFDWFTFTPADQKAVAAFNDIFGYNTKFKTVQQTVENQGAFLFNKDQNFYRIGSNIPPDINSFTISHEIKGHAEFIQSKSFNGNFIVTTGFGVEQYVIELIVNLVGYSLDDNSPVAVDDTYDIYDVASTFEGNSVLLNDLSSISSKQPVGDMGTVVGIYDIYQNSGNIGSPLRGIYGSITLQGNGEFSYSVSKENLFIKALSEDSLPLLEEFTYTLQYSSGKTDSGKISLIIYGSNDPPFAMPDVAYVSEDSTVYTDQNGVLFNDIDVDDNDYPPSNANVGGILSNTGSLVLGLAKGQYGNIFIQKNGKWNYSLNTELEKVNSLSVGDILEEVFEYSMYDQGGESSIGKLKIVITGENDAPIGVDDFATIEENSINYLGISVLSNDTDVDRIDLPYSNGEVILLQSNTSIGSVGEPLLGSYGSLLMSADGTYTYSIDNSINIVDSLQIGEKLVESFYYTFADIGGKTGNGKLSITINGENDPPIANSDENVIHENDSSIDGSSVLANDTDVDSLLPPLVSGLVSGIKSSTKTGNVGAPFNGSYGTILMNANGTYSYKLDNSYVDVDELDEGDLLFEEFDYTLTGSIDGEKSVGTLTITIIGSNDPPVAKDDEFVLFEDELYTNLFSNVISNDIDVDGDDKLMSNALLVSISTSRGELIKLEGSIPNSIEGRYGTLLIYQNGLYTYSVDNNNPLVDMLGEGQSISEVFVYTLSDKNGSTDSAELEIRILGVNDSPRANTSVRALSIPEQNNAVKLFSSTTISLVEQNQKILAFGLSVQGLSNGLNEKLIFDSTEIPLFDGVTGVIPTLNTIYLVSTTPESISVEFTSQGLSNIELEHFLNNLYYQNIDNDPTTSQRTISIRMLQDSGGISNGGKDISLPNLSSTINILPINDAPTAEISSLNSEFFEGQDLVLLFDVINLAMMETMQLLKEVEIHVYGLKDVNSEMLVIDGEKILLKPTQQAYTSTSNIGYKFIEESGLLKITLNFESVSVHEAKNLLSSLGYINANDASPSAGERLFTIKRLQDNGGTDDSGRDTLTIDVTSKINIWPVNDAPEIRGPLSKVSLEDTSVLFNKQALELSPSINLEIDDVDARNNPVKLDVTIYNGTCLFRNESGIEIDYFENSLYKRYSLIGNIGDINNALENLAYRPLDNFYGKTYVDLKLDDLGNSGLGGPLTDFHTITLYIQPVQDAPQLIGLPEIIEIEENTLQTEIRLGLFDRDTNNAILNLTADVIQTDNNPIQSVSLKKLEEYLWNLNLQIVPNISGYGSIKFTYSDDSETYTTIVYVRVVPKTTSSFGLNTINVNTINRLNDSTVKAHTDGSVSPFVVSLQSEKEVLIKTSKLAKLFQARIIKEQKDLNGFSLKAIDSDVDIMGNIFMLPIDKNKTHQFWLIEH
jgi:VCBS repeat-containing protein